MILIHKLQIQNVNNYSWERVKMSFFWSMKYSSELEVARGSNFCVNYAQVRGDGLREIVCARVFNLFIVEFPLIKYYSSINYQRKTSKSCQLL